MHVHPASAACKALQTCQGSEPRIEVQYGICNVPKYVTLQLHLPSSANECILGSVYLRSNLSRKVSYTRLADFTRD